MPSARPSEAMVTRLLTGAAKAGRVARAMDVLPDGTVRLLFEEPESVAPSAPSSDAEDAWDAALGTRP